MNVQELARELAVVQQRALLRLHLVVTGETHRLLAGAMDGIQRALLEEAVDGDLDELLAARAVEMAERVWRSTFQAWERMFSRARLEAAAIPLGSLAAFHRYYGALVPRAVEEQLVVQPPLSPVFGPQLQAVLQATDQRVYRDGLRLSDRIWRLDHDGLQGIRRTIYTALVQGRSAWDTARDLERFLGANADCPRWTSTRLYRLSPRQRMVSDTGLYRGSPCESRGVAYNALRLARNEIQIAHHMATRALMERQPWVEGKWIRLSAEHPEPDICDEYAAGGPYEVAEEILPLHVQCLCYAEAALMEEAAFISRIRGWLRGEESWPEMDMYQAWVVANVMGPGERMVLGREILGLPLEVGEAMEAWAQGDYEMLQGRLFSWEEFDG